MEDDMFRRQSGVEPNAALGLLNLASARRRADIIICGSRNTMLARAGSSRSKSGQRTLDAEPWPRWSPTLNQAARLPLHSFQLH